MRNDELYTEGRRFGMMLARNYNHLEYLKGIKAGINESQRVVAVEITEAEFVETAERLGLPLDFDKDYSALARVLDIYNPAHCIDVSDSLEPVIGYAIDEIYGTHPIVGGLPCLRV